MGTAADSNAISVLEQSLAKATPGSKEQTQISLALYDLRAKQNAGKSVKDDPSTKTDTTAKKDNVTPVGTIASSESPDKRRTNPLSSYSSSTYRISLYMITPESFANFNETGKWNLNSMLLLVQSGGQNSKVDAQRNPFFGLDMYIDGLEITTLIGTKETGTASTSYAFRFQIYEPYGISFTSRLVDAAIEMQKQSNIERDITQPLSALGVHYMIAIHFYGYDSEGHLVTSPSTPDGNPSSGANGAAFERLFPVLFTKMSSRLDNRTAVYDISANMVSQAVAFSNTRGVIPEATTISAETVGDALKNLASILNKKQELKSGEDPKLKREVPDEYRFVFQNESGIEDALIVDKNHFVIGNAPMPEVLGPLNINVRLSDSGRAETVSKQQRSIQLAAGSPILSVIDQIITQSTYVTKVLKIVDKEEMDKVKKTDKDYVENAKPEPLYWYHVTPQVSVKNIDKKRNEFAYTMTYIIQRKEVPYVRSTAVGRTTSYKGPFKKYDYWYTGKNSEIISYDQTFNLLYFVTAAASSEAANRGNNDPAPVKDVVVSEASGTGSLPDSKENVNTVRTSLYSPGDNLHAHLTILGDPDYLMTSEAGTVDTITNKWYGEDFTINPANSQIFIEVGFNQVTDYDTGLGYMPTNDNIFFWDYPAEIKQTTKAMIYMILSLKSRFDKGRFTQDIRTILPPFLGSDADKPADQRAETASTSSSGSSKPYKEAFDSGKQSGWDTPKAFKPTPKTFQSVVPTVAEDTAGNSVLTKKPSSIFVNQYGRK